MILNKQEDPMEIMEVKNEVKLFLLHSFRIKEIDFSDNIFDTGAMHSLFYIQLLVFIEKKFKLDLNVGEFDPKQLTSIDNIAQFIFSKL
jgi:acyl carrier protein